MPYFNSPFEDRNWFSFSFGATTKEMPIRVMFANGQVIDMVGLLSKCQRTGRPGAFQCYHFHFQARMAQVYNTGEQAPTFEQEQLALESGPIDGEILDE